MGRLKPVPGHAGSTSFHYGQIPCVAPNQPSPHSQHADDDLIVPALHCAPLLLRSIACQCRVWVILFPMLGEKEGWSELAKNVKAEIDEKLIEA
jgi:hypothetical protein